MRYHGNVTMGEWSGTKTKLVQRSGRGYFSDFRFLAVGGLLLGSGGGLLFGVLVIGGVVYLLLRRRRPPQGSLRAARPVTGRLEKLPAPQGMATPATQVSIAGGDSPAESSSSTHPGYPEAPLAYADDHTLSAESGTSEPQPWRAAQGDRRRPNTPDRRAGDRRQNEPQRGISAKPWYPEPPASYLETEGQDASWEPAVSTHPAYPDAPPQYPSADDESAVDAADERQRQPAHSKPGERPLV